MCAAVLSLQLKSEARRVREEKLEKLEESSTVMQQLDSGRRQVRQNGLQDARIMQTHCVIAPPNRAAGVGFLVNEARQCGMLKGCALHIEMGAVLHRRCGG